MDFNFPKTEEEVRDWKPTHYMYPLASTALVVAKTRVEGTWCAYAKGVNGFNHEHEKYDVAAHGDKVSEKIARVMFPQFGDADSGIPYSE